MISADTVIPNQANLQSPNRYISAGRRSPRHRTRRVSILLRVDRADMAERRGTGVVPLSLFVYRLLSKREIERAFSPGADRKPLVMSSLQDWLTNSGKETQPEGLPRPEQGL